MPSRTHPQTQQRTFPLISLPKTQRLGRTNTHTWVGTNTPTWTWALKSELNFVSHCWNLLCETQLHVSCADWKWFRIFFFLVPLLRPDRVKQVLLSSTDTNRQTCRKHTLRESGLLTNHYFHSRLFWFDWLVVWSIKWQKIRISLSPKAKIMSSNVMFCPQLIGLVCCLREGKKF